MGLGGGGYSRLGMSRDKSEAESITIIAAAIYGGVNFIDTAEAYKTESLIGKGIRNTRRDRLVISSKKTPRIDVVLSGLIQSPDPDYSIIVPPASLATGFSMAPRPSISILTTSPSAR